MEIFSKLLNVLISQTNHLNIQLKTIQFYFRLPPPANYRERRARQNGFFPQSQPTNENTDDTQTTQFQGSTRSTTMSARKLFRDSKADAQMADKEGYFPSQI